MKKKQERGVHTPHDDPLSSGDVSSSCGGSALVNLSEGSTTCTKDERWKWNQQRSCHVPVPLENYDELSETKVALNAGVSFRAGIVDLNRGHPSEALVHFTNALRTRRLVHGAVHIKVAITYEHVADASAELRDLANALKSYDSALDIMRLLRGSNSYHVARILVKKADAFLRINEKVSSTACFVEALAIMDRFDASGKLGHTMDIQLKLGHLYYEREEYDHALRSFLEAMNGQETCISRHDWPAIHHKMGTMYEKLGANGKAIDCFETELAMRLRTVESPRQKVVANLMRLGGLCGKSAKFEDALGHYEHLIRCLLEDVDDGTLKASADDTTLRHRLKLYEGYSLRQKGRGWFDNSRSDADAVSSALAVADAMNNMGNVYSLKGSCKEALQCYRSSLRIRTDETVYHECHLDDVLRSKCNLALTLKKIGRHQSALATFSDILGSQEKTLGEKSVDVSNTLNRMGNIYCKMGSFEVAVRYYTTALKIQNKKHETGILFNMGQAFFKMGKYNDCINCFEEVLARQTASRARSVAGVVDIPCVVGDTYRKERDYIDVLAHYEGTFTSRKRGSGKGHLDVIRTLHNIGLVKCKLEVWDEALAILTAVLESTKKVMGEDHLDVGRLSTDLIVVHIARCDFDEAQLLYQAASRIFDKAKIPDSHKYKVELKSFSVPLAKSNSSNNRGCGRTSTVAC